MPCSSGRLVHSRYPNKKTCAAPSFLPAPNTYFLTVFFFFFFSGSNIQTNDNKGKCKYKNANGLTVTAPTYTCVCIFTSKINNVKWAAQCQVPYNQPITISSKNVSLPVTDEHPQVLPATFLLLNLLRACWCRYAAWGTLTPRWVGFLVRRARPIKRPPPPSSACAAGLLEQRMAAQRAARMPDFIAHRTTGRTPSCLFFMKRRCIFVAISSGSAHSSHSSSH